MKAFAQLVLLALIFSLWLSPRLGYAGHGNSDEDGDKHQHEKHQHEKHKHQKERYHKHKGYADEVAYHGPYFTTERVTVIRQYYTPETLRGLPPGLRKHLERTGHLPPGLEKRLVVNQTLPPQYLPDLVPAPPELVSRMGPLPPDSQLYFYNGDAILVNPKTQAVMDIVHGVLGLSSY